MNCKIKKIRINPLNSLINTPSPSGREIGSNVQGAKRWGERSEATSPRDSSDLSGFIPERSGGIWPREGREVVLFIYMGLNDMGVCHY